MARSRLLKPDFYEDEKITTLPFGARYLYTALWCLADREGRLEDRPSRIAAFAFPPMGNEKLQAQARRDVPTWLELLVSAGILQRYEVEGEGYMLIRHFLDHQKIHPNEPKSILPPPMVTNGYQGTPMVTNVAGNDSDSTSTSDSKAEAKAEAETIHARAFSPVEVEDRSFAGQYVWHHEQSKGMHPGGSAVAAAEQLERDFGLEACVTYANDLNWEKHPNYMRPGLLQRAKEKANGDGSGEGGGKSAAAEGAGGVADRVSGLDRRRAAIAARG